MELEVFYKTIHKVSAPSGAHCFEKTVNVLQKHGNNGKGSVCDEIIFLTNPYLFQPPLSCSDYFWIDHFDLLGQEHEQILLFCPTSHIVFKVKNFFESVKYYCGWQSNQQISGITLCQWTIVHSFFHVHKGNSVIWVQELWTNFPLLLQKECSFHCICVTSCLLLNSSSLARPTQNLIITFYHWVCHCRYWL